MPKRHEYVTTRVWESKRLRFDFPELSDPILKVAGLGEKPEIGVAFSGGGTRAASAGLGQIRALHHLDLIKNVRYFSCVSGGAWTCVPYTFLPSMVKERYISEDEFLGKVEPDPSKLKMDFLSDLDERSMAKAISKSTVVKRVIKQYWRGAGDESYARAIGDIFLRPFALNDLSKFFTLNDISRDAIIANNPDMRINDFYKVERDRPYLIVGATVLRKKDLHFELTPLYVGSWKEHLGLGASGRPIGGGYVEPIAFDSQAPDNYSFKKVAKTRLGKSKHKFTLSDVIGTSGSAPAKVVRDLGITWAGFPEFRHWPPSAPSFYGDKEYEFGDGGILENLGIMPLLKRQMKRIVVFVNTAKPLKKKNPLVRTQINTSVRALFRQTGNFTLNHIFPIRQFEDLIKGLLSAQAAEGPVVFEDEYDVITNRHYGIQGGWRVKILWVYNDKVNRWKKNLPPDTRQRLADGSFGAFPHYATFLESKGRLIDLTNHQVSLLAHLSCWNILEEEKRFRKFISP